MRQPQDHVIYLHPAAPPKPPVGKACNGCGVCCASEPCPVGALVSRRRRGACAALVWADGKHAGTGLYRCGLIEQPQVHLPTGLRWSAPLVRRLAHRFISASTGCDSHVMTTPAD